MTLFLQTDAGGAGTGGVFADRGFTDLVQIANMDTGVGQAAPVGDLIQITYARTLGGVPPNRLDTLVNTDFAGVAGTTDIIVIAVDQTFTRSNGTLITANAGVTLPVGNTENPTSSVLVIYDTSDNDGNGYCLPAEGGGTVGFPASVILYHELSHALRFATSSSLDNSDTGCAANPEEHQAEIDENDMRAQLGVTHRDTTQHCTTSGCQSNCCVVASIATGSPYSANVGALRRVRDDVLRRSEVGFDLFEHLHYDYYAFSPQVVGMMEGDPELRAGIAASFVVPLTRALELLRDWAEAPGDAPGLGRRFVEEAERTAEIARLTRGDVRRALAVIRDSGRSSIRLPGRLGELRALIAGRAAESPFIRWALIDPIEIYLAALATRLGGAREEEVGQELATSFERWGAELPLTEIWRELSAYAFEEELSFLASSVTPTPASRARLAGRLIRHLGERCAPGSRLELLLESFATAPVGRAS